MRMLGMELEFSAKSVNVHLTTELFPVPRLFYFLILISLVGSEETNVHSTSVVMR